MLCHQHRLILSDPFLLTLLAIAQHHKNARTFIQTSIETGIGKINLPYASLYARLNEGPRIFVVLGYSEQGQQKWVTQDQAMLVTQHGRLVKRREPCPAQSTARCGSSLRRC